MQALIDLERQGWQALSQPGAAGRAFYAMLLDDDAVMLLPGGIRLDGRASILESFDTQPWTGFELADMRTVTLGRDAAAVIYQVTAQRADRPRYAALVSSTYVRAPDWRLLLHQQTPL